MILHIDKEQSSQGPSVTGEKNLLSPHLGYLIHSSAHLISERTQQKQKKVPGRAEQTNTAGGVTSTRRKVKYFGLRGAEQRGEHSL